MVSFEIAPITEAIGAEISGFDLTKPQNDDILSEIKAAIAKHLVVVFRGQDLSLQQLEFFAKQLGKVDKTPFVEHMDDHSNIIANIREADETGIPFGSSWHSDSSFRKRPPSLTILYAKDVPPIGGDTLFSNQYRAFETLPPEIGEKLKSLNANHSASNVFGAKGALGSPAQKRAMSFYGGRDTDASQSHPVIRTHPVTNKKALFVNPTYVHELEGIEPEESRRLLDFLFAHGKQEKFICRVKWTAGSLVIWDNRCTLHYAENNYSGYRREMYRLILAGEQPQ
jgi:taurine dioxygenase